MQTAIGELFFSVLKDFITDKATTIGSRIKDYGDTVETLKREVKKLSYQAIDTEEELKQAERTGTKKRKRAVNEWLEDVEKVEEEFNQWVEDARVGHKEFFRQFFDGGKVEKMIRRVQNLLEQRQGFTELVLDDEMMAPFILGSLEGYTAVQDIFKEILNKLNAEEVSSIGIHGMGGVGKTYLAKQLYNYLLKAEEASNGNQSAQKPDVFWITVPHDFTVKDLQGEIARKIHLDLSTEDNEDLRAARLHRALSGIMKKIVFIFDDVWKNINLEKIGAPLSVEGCKLIITTRSRVVCDQIGCQLVFKVETLKNDEDWRLFKDTLGSGMTLTPKVEKIARCMVKKCDGLPLGIIAIAGSMKGKNEIFEWRNALKQLGELSMGEEDDKEEKVLKILKYSFDRLNRGGKCDGYTKIQRCFLCCCLYPQGKEIDKLELINHFISEELLSGNRMEQLDGGQDILNTLVNVCLLEKSIWGEYLKMHDFVRAMALNITNGEYMIIERQRNSLKEIMDQKENCTKDLEVISLINNGIRDLPNEWSPECPKLTTLLLQRNPNLKFIPGAFFSKMRGLHVLNLSYTGIEMLPDLSNLGCSLKTLLLRGCSALRHLPDMGNLKALKELDLSSTSVTGVPQGMEKLVNLEHLNLVVETLEELPRNLLQNFQKLQCLHLPCQLEAPAEDIQILEQLEEFEGRVKDVDDFKQLMRCQRTPDNQHIGSCFVIVGDYDIVFTYLTKNFYMDGNREVIMWRINLNTEGTGDAIRAPDVEQLTLDRCVGYGCLLDYLRHNINIKSLEHLSMSRCDGVTCVFEANGNQEWPFQNLLVMRLWMLHDFKGMMISQGPGPADNPVQAAVLKQLEITFCSTMKNLELQGWRFPNLEKLNISWCDEIEEIIKARDEHGEDPVRLPNLKTLVLHGLPKLNTICNTTVVCKSLERIDMEDCDNLTNLPLAFGEPYHSPPSNLQRITLNNSNEEWWRSLQLAHSSLRGFLDPLVIWET